MPFQPIGFHGQVPKIQHSEHNLPAVRKALEAPRPSDGHLFSRDGVQLNGNSEPQLMHADAMKFGRQRRTVDSSANMERLKLEGRPYTALNGDIAYRTIGKKGRLPADTKAAPEKNMQATHQRMQLEGGRYTTENGDIAFHTIGKQRGRAAESQRPQPAFIPEPVQGEARLVRQDARRFTGPNGESIPPPKERHVDFNGEKHVVGNGTVPLEQHVTHDPYHQDVHNRGTKQLTPEQLEAKIARGRNAPNNPEAAHKNAQYEAALLNRAEGGNAKAADWVDKDIEPGGHTFLDVKG